MAAWLPDLLAALFFAPAAARLPWLAWEACGVGQPYASALISVAALAAAAGAVSFGARALARIADQPAVTPDHAGRACCFLLMTSAGASLLCALAIAAAGAAMGFAFPCTP